MQRETSLPQAAPSGGTPVTALLWRALVESAAAIREAGISAIASDQEELSESLPVVWDALWTAARAPVESVPPTPATRRLLNETLRRFVAVLRCCEEAPNAQDVLRALNAIERLETAIERDLSQAFRERLAGPGGLELLIEVAHDLRSPLTSILYLAESLGSAQSGRVDPWQERQLALIYSSAFELNSLANDLMDLARGGDELMERAPVDFSIAAVLRSVRDIAAPVAEERGLELQLELPRNERRIGHPAALGRVMLNLVTNALRCTTHGFVRLEARDRADTIVEFAVTDTGPGIPDHVMAAFFEPFHSKTAGTGRGFSSSGLGLAICRRLVSRMGGALQVRSRPREGSCFFFELRLPVAGPPEEASERTHSSMSHAEGSAE